MVYLLNKYIYMWVWTCVCVCVSQRASKMAAGHFEDYALPPLECLRHVAGVRANRVKRYACVCVFAKLENVTRCMQGKTEEHN